jgi:glucuronoarabinoxylan endo-1,4-beta-xylanase
MTGADVAAAAMGKPLFMTEFAPSTGQMLRTAWLIHNALTVEEVSAYVYWSLIWAPSSAGANAADLVTVENPSGPFTTPKGYTINDPYYALKHFARWTDPGWTRVGASTTLGAVKASAFLSPDRRSLTMVLINTDAAAHVVNLGSAGFAFSSSMVYRSSGSSERAQPLSLDAGNSVSLPAGAIATVTR